jgi:hypothetical protein
MIVKAESGVRNSNKRLRKGGLCLLDSEPRRAEMRKLSKVEGDIRKEQSARARESGSV